MKIVIFGGAGQLGSDFQRMARLEGIDVISCDLPEIDITAEAQVLDAVKHHSPDIVINAAAYTAVDKAEQEAKIAYAVNRDGAKNCAIACQKVQIPLIHISTDYVFNGENTNPYTETDEVFPIGVYGQSKWEGECAVRELLDKHLIIRISWVFGFYGQNFVKTMQRLARERDELSIVGDQYGCPTATRALSYALIKIARTAIDNAGPWGTYHYSCAPPTNWYEFAKVIIAETKQYETLKVKNIKSISTQEYPTPAQRPVNSIMDCRKIKKDYAIEQVSWKEELKQVVQELCKQ